MHSVFAVCAVCAYQQLISTCVDLGWGAHAVVAAYVCSMCISACVDLGWDAHAAVYLLSLYLLESY